MSATADSNTGILNPERELVCFICTEILYQPLTLIDCLHTFCGACLKEWFSHQYRKAVSSRTPSTSNPYTCPTCRATVKDARPNAMVNTWLDLFLTANPSRGRSEEDKQELSANYKPGDKIMPKPGGGRRREHRHRQQPSQSRMTDDATERQMIEEARERSLRDLQIEAESSTDHLQPPASSRQSQGSRSREREDRRDRRREQDRRRRAEAASHHQAMQSVDPSDDERDQLATILPTRGSLRHPDAVEARQRQQTVAHQASLVSLISSSENSGGTGTGTGDSAYEQSILQEILAEGLLDGVDTDALTEAEQDMWVQRVVEAYRQRRFAAQDHEAVGNAPVSDHTSNSRADHAARQVEPRSYSEQGRSLSNTRRADTQPLPVSEEPPEPRPRSARTQPLERSSPQAPPSAPVTTYRRRRSSQNSESLGIPVRSRGSSPGSRSTHSASRSRTDLGTSSRAGESTVAHSRASRPSSFIRTPTDPRSSPSASQLIVVDGADQAPPADHSSSQASRARSDVPPTASAAVGMKAEFDEPSITCFKCHRADIQYTVYRHCKLCELNLCLRCYRTGRGCKHWFGFGRMALVNFEALHSDRRDSEPVPLPHLLVARSYLEPDAEAIVSTKLAKDGTTEIALRTTSDPRSRSLEGYFCDRCGCHANQQFWMCDFCNDGEWGFCKDCVDTHHCCTHPLLPVKQATSATSPDRAELLVPDVNTTLLHHDDLAASSTKHTVTSTQPPSASSVSSFTMGPVAGFNPLTIPIRCNLCFKPIAPLQPRYHCPFHPSPSTLNPNSRGNYDICEDCYHGLVKSNRVKRDEGPAGWRRCMSGHRMIVTVFVPDNRGGHKRVVEKDLVGGRKMNDDDVTDYMEALTRQRDATASASVGNPIGNALRPKGRWTWRDDSTSTKQTTRVRGVTISPTIHSPRQSPDARAVGHDGDSAVLLASKFPPDGGFGARAVARWSYYPEDGEDGQGELAFPRGAEIRELEDVNGEWWSGIYAGDEGFGLLNYLRT